MELDITSYCHITAGKVIVNDKLRFYQGNFSNFATFIKEAFKQNQITYPKFYKMDLLSKLGFLASECVLNSGRIDGYEKDTVGVVFSNSSSSLDTDILHNDTICNRNNYFPSPSVFVYTLPNIVIGEVCIRHKIKGENAFLITEKFEPQLIYDVVHEHFENSRMEACLCGWVELKGENHNAFVMLVEKRQNIESEEAFKPVIFSPEKMRQIIENN